MPRPWPAWPPAKSPTWTPPPATLRPKPFRPKPFAGDPAEVLQGENPAAEDSRVALAESAVVGMVLHERIIVALHRLAQEDASSRYFG